MATHSSVLAWRIPGTEKPGRLQSPCALDVQTVGRAAPPEDHAPLPPVFAVDFMLLLAASLQWQVFVDENTASMRLLAGDNMESAMSSGRPTSPSSARSSTSSSAGENWVPGRWAVSTPA